MTIKNDIITTAAHSIFPNEKACGNKNEAVKCKFVTQFRGKTETYEVESMVSTGFDCGMSSRKPGSDWAVLKLKKPVDSRIRPYRVNKDISMHRRPDEPLTVVGKSDDFPRLGIPPKDVPKHYGDCEAKGGANFDFNRITLSNCDTGHRASGGAVLTRGANPVLLGVSKGGFVNEADSGKRCPSADRKKNSGKYSECWATVSTDVSGDFADALTQVQNTGVAPQIENDPVHPAAGPEVPSQEQNDL